MAEVDGKASSGSRRRTRTAETTAAPRSSTPPDILYTAGNVLYTAGNAGNGGNPQPDGVITGTGAQILRPEVKAVNAQTPGGPTPVGSSNITQLGDTPTRSARTRTSAA